MTNPRTTPDSDTEIAAERGNSGDPNAAVIALRHLADAHAVRLAKGERRIANITKIFRAQFVSHVEERVELEKRQCELLLRLERDVPYGQRTVWKWELACALLHTVGARYSVAGIEERLTSGRRGELDPGYWTLLEVALLNLGTFDFRKAHRSLKAKDSDQGDEVEVMGPNSPVNPANDDDGEPEEDHDGDIDASDDADGREAAATDDSPPKQLPSEVTDILDASELATDADLAVLLAEALVKAKATVAELMAENARLRAEVERLSTPPPGATPVDEGSGS